MSSGIDLVIFDCDGVLVDTERLAVRVDVQVLAQLGWVMTEAEVVERFVGLSDATIREAIEAHTGRRLADNWEQEFTHLYRSSFAESLTAVDGVVEALDGITLRTCVASSGTHEKMRFTLGLTGLLERFEGRMFSVTEVERGKPAPDLFLHAASRMGVPPAACAVVEDSRFGVEAARAAGMRAFGYAGGLTPAHLLAGSGTVVFTDMRKLPRLLGIS
ncbi:MAG TPA: HAD family hydrolase [Methylomirabilota bacterium]